MRSNIVRFGYLLGVFCPLICFWLTVETRGQDWPALRGENGAGSIRPGGILSNSSAVDLKVRWKKKIGSGYSSLVLERGRLVTLYTLGDEDVIECLDTSDGRSIWREAIDRKFPGENGSFDGPLATPVLHQGRVYGLTPRGKVFCRSLDDGQELWSRDLVAEEKAVQPLYGFVSSPLIAAGNLIVQVGAKDKSIAAFDLNDGHTVWAIGNDEVSSQSPSRILVEGKEIVLAVGGKKLVGVDPIAGTICFECEHGGGNSTSVVPVVLDNHTTLLTLDDSFSKAFTITASGDTLTVGEKWKDRSIKNTYNVPALVNDWLFAYSTRLLTCVDPATGAAKWKERNPGDGFLVAVDGKLIISTKTGSLHIAEASPEGYHELAKLQLFDDLVWSIPAYSDNAIYQRSLGEVACVDIIPGTASDVADANSKEVLGPKFASLLERVSATGDGSTKQKLVDDFLAANPSAPLIEDNIVHFLYQGPATDAALAGDMFGARQERAMIRVPETDLFYYAMELPRDQRANYVFLIDYQPQADERNPRRARSSMYAGEMEFAVRLAMEKPLEMSWFSMPEWKAPAWESKLADVPAKTWITEKLKSEILEDELTFEVCLPPSHAAESSAKRFPVIYVMDGPGAKEFGRLPEVAELLYADGTPEAILVLVNSMVAGPFGGQPFDEVLAKEIVPLVDSKYSTIASREGRSLMGIGFTSDAALAALTKHPDLFAAASLQSPLLFDQARADAARLVADIKLPTRVYVEWGRFDMFNPHENWDLRTIAKQVHDSLQGNAQVEVTGGMVNDSTDWSSWRNRFEPVLEFLIGS